MSIEQNPEGSVAELTSSLVADVIGDATEQTLDEFMSSLSIHHEKSATDEQMSSDPTQRGERARGDLAWLELLSAMSSSPLLNFVACVDTAGSTVREILLGSLLHVPVAESVVSQSISAAAMQRYDLATCVIQRWARGRIIPRSLTRRLRQRKCVEQEDLESRAREIERDTAARMVLRVVSDNFAKAHAQRYQQQEAAAVEQEVLSAVLILQRAGRIFCSKVAVANRRQLVMKTQQRLVWCEAALSLQSFFRLAHAKCSLKRLRKKKDLELELTNQSGAATIIQSRWRGAKGREYAEHTRAQRLLRAVGAIQRVFRGYKARSHARRMRAEREANDVRQKLIEVVVRLQSFARLVIYQRRKRSQRASIRLVRIVKLLGAGYRARRNLGTLFWRIVAAKKIQIAVRSMLARRRVARVRKNHEIIQRQLREYFAALIIQRNWRIVAAKKEVVERREEAVKENIAALRLQRFYTIVRAKGRRRQLKLQQGIERETRLITRAALLLTSVARGFLVRRRNAIRRERFINAASLMHRVVSGYVTRLYSCRAAHVYKRHLSASIIQRKWSDVLETRQNDARRTHKLAILTGWRRQHYAAVLIQAQMRRFLCRTRFLKLNRVLHYAATKIQTRFRMLLARRVLDHLVDQLWASACALRIQTAWLKVRQRFRQRREVSDLEKKIRKMDWTALLRDEGIKRYALQQDENDLFTRTMSYFQLVLARLEDEYADRLDLWRAQNPPQLREFAAMKVQAYYRGYRTRCALEEERNSRRIQEKDGGALTLNSAGNRALTELEVLKTNSDKQHQLMIESKKLETVADGHAALKSTAISSSSGVVGDVATGLRLLRQLSNATASSTTSVVVDVPTADGAQVDESSKSFASSSWLAWMLQYPELRSRQCERLLQREHAARRKIWNEHTVSCGQFALHLHTVAAMNRASGVLAGRREGSSPQTCAVEGPAIQAARARREQQALTASAAAHRVFLPPIVEERASALASPAAFSATFVTAALNDAAAGSSHIDLSNLGVTHVELRPLLERLQSNSDSLESLVLDGNRLTDIACSDIASIVIHSTKLRTLSLRNNRITDTGISHIIAAASRSPSLEVLDVGGTLVTERYRSHILRLLSAPRTTLGLSNARRTGVVTAAAGEEDIPLVAVRTVAPPPSVAHLAPSRQPAAVVPPYRLMKVEMVLRQTRGALEDEESI